MEAVSWGKAFQVFMVGFGGVFSCLVILELSILLYSKVARQIDAGLQRKKQ